MNRDDLDRAFSRQADIIPSSGFLSNVMDAVQREATMAPPIPFPWKYALPGLAAWVITLGSLAFAVARHARQIDTLPTPAVHPVLVAIAHGAQAIGAGWIAVALLLWFASVRLSTRLLGVRTRF